MRTFQRDDEAWWEAVRASATRRLLDLHGPRFVLTGTVEDARAGGSEADPEGAS